jgi:hypothetical protein
MKLFIILINIILAGSVVHAMEPLEDGALNSQSLTREHSKSDSEDESGNESFGQRLPDESFELSQAIYDGDLGTLKDLVSKTDMFCWYAGLFENAVKGHLDILKYLYSLPSEKVRLPNQNELDKLLGIAVKGGYRNIAAFLLTGLSDVVSEAHLLKGSVALLPSADKIDELRGHVSGLKLVGDCNKYNKRKILELLSPR